MNWRKCSIAYGDRRDETFFESLENLELRSSILEKLILHQKEKDKLQKVTEKQILMHSNHSRYSN